MFRSVQVLEAARKAGAHVVFSSTGGAIYGECPTPADEDSPALPLSPYGTSKLCGEAYLAAWTRIYGMANVVTRFANVYGPRQDSGLEGGVVAIFLERMARGESTKIYGDGEQSRDFVYVGDVVRALLVAATHESGVFTIGTGDETTVTELHRVCREVSGAAEEPAYDEARLGDVRRSVLDPSRAARELGWKAETSLSAGLAETWSWTTEQLD